ncbi:MAG TPA: SpoIIIAH-like family protein [Candidatus Scatovivens faecipullorum]|nr:SpoIIIAH-like family protein [Candidatus Scatovivens faecipullorum]
MKKNKEKFKQLFLSFLAFFLIGLGYFNWNLDQKSNNLELSSNSNDINIGDVELVNSEPVKEFENSIVTNTAIVSNEDLKSNIVENENNIKNNVENNTENNIYNNQVNDNYFEETKIQRDRMYSEMTETYQKLIDSEETPVDQKSIAVQEISNITKIKNGIMISENLIKNKGFENVVILVNSGKVNVVVKSQKLLPEQISQIQNIVERELEIQVSNISISNKY